MKRRPVHQVLEDLRREHGGRRKFTVVDVLLADAIAACAVSYGIPNNEIYESLCRLVDEFTVKPAS